MRPGHNGMPISSAFKEDTLILFSFQHYICPEFQNKSAFVGGAYSRNIRKE